jgi:TRAP-type C4-dicarboxylate transport system permease small subunit
MNPGNPPEKFKQKIQCSSTSNAFRYLKILDKAIYNVGLIGSVISVTVMVLIIFAQVFYRYVIGHSLIWSEELGRYLLIWSTFLGMGVLGRQGDIMSITMVVDKLSPRLRFLTVILADTLSIFFLGIVFFYGIRLVKNTMAQLTVVTQVPMGLIYLVIPLGAGFYMLHIIIGYIRKLEKREAEC